MRAAFRDWDNVIDFPTTLLIDGLAANTAFAVIAMEHNEPIDLLYEDAFDKRAAIRGEACHRFWILARPSLRALVPLVAIREFPRSSLRENLLAIS